jgi:hypothetical protein
MAAIVLQKGAPFVASKVYRVSLYWAGEGQIFITGYDLYVTSFTPGGAYLADLADAVYQNMNGWAISMCPAVVTFLGVRISVRQAAHLLVPLAGIFGTIGGDPCTGGGALIPTQSAAIITLQTANSAPAGRGRMYLPPTGGTNLTNDGLPAAGYLSLMNAIGNFIVFTGAYVSSSAFTFNAEPVVWHRDSLLSTPIVSWRSNVKFGTQKRRGSYGELNSPAIPG